MDINVKLIKEIVNECLALHHKFNPAGRKSLRRLYRNPAILILISVFLIYQGLENVYLALLPAALGLGLYFFMRRLLLHSGNMVIKSLGKNASFTMQASEDEVITQTAKGINQSNWSVFTEALISNNLVLLYQRNRTFSMLHRSFFAPDDFEVFKAIVRKNITPLTEVGTKF